MVNNKYTMIGILCISALTSAASEKRTFKHDCYEGKEIIVPGSQQFYAPVIGWKRTEVRIGDRLELHERIGFVAGPDKNIVKHVANVMNGKLDDHLFPSAPLLGLPLFKEVMNDLKQAQPESVEDLEKITFDSCERSGISEWTSTVYVLPKTVHNALKQYDLDFMKPKHVEVLERLAQLSGPHHSALYLILDLKRFGWAYDHIYTMIHH